MFTTVLVVYALFADDIRLVVTSKPADFLFDVVTVIALIVFLTDLIAASFGKEDYWLSFFFYMDLVATLSLVLDISSVAALIAGGGVGDGTDLFTTQF